MRLFRHLLMIVAMLSMAALPGPSHAFPHGEGVGAHANGRVAQASIERPKGVPAQSADIATQNADPDHDCPDHGKCCATACCAPTCLPFGDQLTFLPAPRWTFATVDIQTDDAVRDGAVLGLPKRPPKNV